MERDKDGWPQDKLGDIFRPLGLGGIKLIRKACVDSNVPVFWSFEMIAITMLHKTKEKDFRTSSGFVNAVRFYLEAPKISTV